MTDQPMAQVTVTEYQALVKRVEALEKIVQGQPAQVETAPKSGVTDVRALIQEMQNEYAKYPSFTKVLLAERARDRGREEARIRARQLRTVRAPAKRKKNCLNQRRYS